MLGLDSSAEESEVSVGTVITVTVKDMVLKLSREEATELATKLNQELGLNTQPQYPYIPQPFPGPLYPWTPGWPGSAPNPSQPNVWYTTTTTGNTGCLHN